MSCPSASLNRSQWSTPASRWAPRTPCAATMYKLDAIMTLQHDVMGPAHVTDPPFCTGGAGLWSTVNDYLRFARMLLAYGTLDGVEVLSEDPCD